VPARLFTLDRSMPSYRSGATAGKAEADDLARPTRSQGAEDRKVRENPCSEGATAGADCRSPSARSRVESERYNNVSEVVRFGSRLLQEAEERRVRFGPMLDEFRAEADRDRTHDVESVAREIDDIIAASK
jgi:antitoxin ParD1/3/4